MLIDNEIIKILLLLDRRVGRRSPLKIKSEILNDNGIIQYFYKLRSDNIMRY